MYEGESCGRREAQSRLLLPYIWRRRNQLPAVLPLGGTSNSIILRSTHCEYILFPALTEYSDISIQGNAPGATSMSDIPLHSFRRSRKQRSDYIPLNTNEDDDGDEESDGTDHNSTTSNSMPSAVSRAAVASVSANRNQKNTDSRWKGKRRQRYADDPEEHVNLLGDDAEEFAREEQERERLAETASQVRMISLVP